MRTHAHEEICLSAGGQSRAECSATISECSQLLEDRGDLWVVRNTWYSRLCGVDERLDERVVLPADSQNPLQDDLSVDSILLLLEVLVVSNQAREDECEEVC